MKNVTLVLAIVLFCLAGLAGIVSWPAPETSVGYFKISTNPYGVAVYQEGRHASIQFAGAKTFTVRGNTITIPSASVVSYSRDDIIFDASVIYTEPTQEQIDYLKRPKVAVPERIMALPQTIYLVNPHIPGMLEFRGKGLIINLDRKQIEGTVQSVIAHDRIDL